MWSRTNYSKSQKIRINIFHRFKPWVYEWIYRYTRKNSDFIFIIFATFIDTLSTSFTCNVAPNVVLLWRVDDIWTLDWIMTGTEWETFLNGVVCIYIVNCVYFSGFSSGWRHQMETFSALLAICAGNSPVSGEFPTQRPVTRSFDVFFDLRLNKRLSKQSWGWWFETLSRSLWRHCNVTNWLVEQLYSRHYSVTKCISYKIH